MTNNLKNPPRPIPWTSDIAVLVYMAAAKLLVHLIFIKIRLFQRRLCS